MSYRRRHRWFRRMALGLAFASVLFAGRVSVAAAKSDEGTGGSRYVTAGGWSGLVDMESGIPLSAGIPHGDEQFIDQQAVQVIPYLSHGLLTEADAQAAAAEAIHDPYPSVDGDATRGQPLRRRARVRQRHRRRGRVAPRSADGRRAGRGQRSRR